MYSRRIKKFQQFMKKENLDGFVINRMVNIRYLCGFSGDTGLLVILTGQAFLLCDSRFYTMARKEVKGARVYLTKSLPLNELKDMDRFQIKNYRFGYESDYLSCSQLKTLQENLPAALLVPMTDSVEFLSIIKDKGEIELIQAAVDIADTAFDRILGYLKPGQRELEVAAELEYQMKMMGSNKPAFDTIVASGFRSAMPHGVASDKKIRKGDFVTFDFGAEYKGYVSDMTRTVIMGKATARQKKIYNLVLRAQRAGIKKVKPGVECRAVDTAARKVIDRAGFKKNFGHGTGHGIGIYVHVKPNVGPRSTDTLKKGMIITVEPGVYIPEWGGVRIEDDVLVTGRGGKVMNQAPKKLLEL
nr:aminopeptidase P family protein [candidate division Zixibacteria bacterium]